MEKFPKTAFLPQKHRSCPEKFEVKILFAASWQTSICFFFTYHVGSSFPSPPSNSLKRFLKPSLIPHQKTLKSRICRLALCYCSCYCYRELVKMLKVQRKMFTKTSRSTWFQSVFISHGVRVCSSWLTPGAMIDKIVIIGQFHTVAAFSILWTFSFLTHFLKTIGTFWGMSVLTLKLFLILFRGYKSQKQPVGFFLVPENACIIKLPAQ